MRSRRAIVVVIAAFALFAQASDADVASRAVVGQIGGPMAAVAIGGNYGIVGDGYRVAVYDISNPTSVSAVGFSDPFGDAVRGITVYGTLAYVAAGVSGLHVIDFSTPTSPTTVGTWNSPGSAEAIALNGTTAYLADGPFGVQILDITTPQQPARAGGFVDDTFVFDVALSGNTLCVAGAGKGLIVADITNPRAPQQTGVVDTPGWARAVALSGTHAVVADSWEDVRIVSIANPASPIEVSSIAVKSWAMDVALSGTKAFVADGSNGLAIIDITNPSIPSQTGVLSAPGEAIAIATNGVLALLADGRAGLYVATVTDPASPQLQDVAPALSDLEGVSVASSYAYVAGSGEAHVIDISNAARPHLTGSFEGSSDEFGDFIAAANGYAYLGVSGLLITLDVSNPALPVETARVDLGTGAFRDMAISGTLLLAATETDVAILDISTPSQPVLRSRILSGAQSVGVSVVGNYAYVAQSEAGMTVLNIANAVAPTVVATYKPRPEFNAAAIEAVSGYAYVGGVGFDVVDINNPANPQFMASIPVGPYRLNRRGTTLYAAAGTSGAYEIDVSTPAAPVITYRTVLPGFVSEVASNGSEIAASLARGGLWLLGGTAGAVTLTASSMPVAPPRRRAFSTAQRMVVAKPLVQRIAASQIVVNSTADSGSGTLRAALSAALSGDAITFDTIVFPSANPATIRPATDLPWVGGGVTIDASNAGVILNGVDLSGSANGLNLGSDGATIKGLHIINFPGIGINVGGSDNVIGGNPASGSGPYGEGNLMSGNGEAGIAFSSSATGNHVFGCVVGLTPSGQTLRFQQPVGVGFARGNGNVVGGTSAAERNVIAGNEIDLGFIVASHNSVIGNFIGTDRTGTQAVPVGTRPFSLMGLNLEGASHDNILTDNVIASENAIGISNTGSSYNRIERNRIGVSSSGGPIGGMTSSSLGIGVDTPYNLIAQNVVGQQALAISISGEGENFVIRNHIGTNSTGTSAIPNTNAGGAVVLFGARREFIGGPSAADANIISGNSGAGLALQGPAVSKNFILGNVIGRNASGATLANGGAGVLIDSSSGNFIQRNTIANNAGSGVELAGSAANRLRRNAITANGGDGLTNSGATGVAATPLIISSTSTTLNGTACAGCLVEIFSDSADEGALYELETSAGSDGAFTATQAAGLTGGNVTAVATDSSGASSIFSNAVTLNGTPPATPTGFDATANSSSAVSVQWNPVSGAAEYVVARKSNGGVAQNIATVTSPTYSDTAVSSNTAYVYTVRAISTGGASSQSTPALATTTAFTDDPVVGGQTIVRAAHLQELRTAVSALCTTAGLATPPWTDSTLTPGVTLIRATHTIELRNKLTDALNALSIPLPSFGPTVAQGILIRASSVQELRDALR